MKFKLNRAFTAASGELDGLIYRNVRGNVIVSRKPDLSNVVYSEDQIAHRARFKQAATYGKAALADPTIRAMYEAAAKDKDIPVFALTIADFFNAPTIGGIDLTGYSGQLGNQIKIIATDDFGVASVHVVITRDDDSAVESGNAVETAQGSGLWVYTITNSIGAGTVVNVRAVATDRPGGTAVLSANKTL